MNAHLARWVDRATALYVRMFQFSRMARRPVPERVLARMATQGERSRTGVFLGASSTRRGKTICHFKYASPQPSGFDENDTVHGLAWIHSAAGSSSSVIVLHGWMMKTLVGLYPVGSRIFAAGADVYFLELPFHLHRRPKGTFSGEWFYGATSEWWISCVRQALAEVEYLLDWLQKRSHQKAGIYGVSIGGWLALLSACKLKDLSFVVAAAPACCLHELSRSSILTKNLSKMPRSFFGDTGTYPGADASQESGTDASASLDPIDSEPLLPCERIALFVADYDEIVPPAFPLRLAQKWKGVKVFHYRQGHITLNVSRDVLTDLGNLVKEYLQ